MPPPKGTKGAPVSPAAALAIEHKTIDAIYKLVGFTEDVIATIIKSAETKEALEDVSVEPASPGAAAASSGRGKVKAERSSLSLTIKGKDVPAKNILSSARVELRTLRPIYYFLIDQGEAILRDLGKEGEIEGFHAVCDLILSREHQLEDYTKEVLGRLKTGAATRVEPSETLHITSKSAELVIEVRKLIDLLGGSEKIQAHLKKYAGILDILLAAARSVPDIRPLPAASAAASAAGSAGPKPTPGPDAGAHFFIIEESPAPAAEATPPKPPVRKTAPTSGVIDIAARAQALEAIRKDLADHPAALANFKAGIREMQPKFDAINPDLGELVSEESDITETAQLNSVVLDARDEQFEAQLGVLREAVNHSKTLPARKIKLTDDELQERARVLEEMRQELVTAGLQDAFKEYFTSGKGADINSGLHSLLGSPIDISLFRLKNTEARFVKAMPNEMFEQQLVLLRAAIETVKAEKTASAGSSKTVRRPAPGVPTPEAVVDEAGAARRKRINDRYKELKTKIESLPDTLTDPRCTSLRDLVSNPKTGLTALINDDKGENSPGRILKDNPVALSEEQERKADNLLHIINSQVEELESFRALALTDVTAGPSGTAHTAPAASAASSAAVPTTGLKKTTDMTARAAAINAIRADLATKPDTKAVFERDFKKERILHFGKINNVLVNFVLRKEPIAAVVITEHKTILGMKDDAFTQQLALLEESIANCVVKAADETAAAAAAKGPVLTPPQLRARAAALEDIRRALVTAELQGDFNNYFITNSRADISSTIVQFLSKEVEVKAFDIDNDNTAGSVKFIPEAAFQQQLGLLRALIDTLKTQKEERAFQEMVPRIVDGLKAAQDTYGRIMDPDPAAIVKPEFNAAIWAAAQHGVEIDASYVTAEPAFKALALNKTFATELDVVMHALQAVISKNELDTRKANVLESVRKFFKSLPPAVQQGVRDTMTLNWAIPFIDRDTTVTPRDINDNDTLRDADVSTFQAMMMALGSRIQKLESEGKVGRLNALLPVYLAAVDAHVDITAPDTQPAQRAIVALLAQHVALPRNPIVSAELDAAEDASSINKITTANFDAAVDALLISIPAAAEKLNTYRYLAEQLNPLVVLYRGLRLINGHVSIELREGSALGHVEIWNLIQMSRSPRGAAAAADALDETLIKRSVNAGDLSNVPFADRDAIDGIVKHLRDFIVSHLLSEMYKELYPKYRYLAQQNKALAEVITAPADNPAANEILSLMKRADVAHIEVINQPDLYQDVDVNNVFPAARLLTAEQLKDAFDAVAALTKNTFVAMLVATLIPKYTRLLEKNGDRAASFPEGAHSASDAQFLQLLDIAARAHRTAVAIDGIFVATCQDTIPEVLRYSEREIYGFAQAVDGFIDTETARLTAEERPGLEDADGDAFVADDDGAPLLAAAALDADDADLLGRPRAGAFVNPLAIGAAAPDAVPGFVDLGALPPPAPELLVGAFDVLAPGAAHVAVDLLDDDLGDAAGLPLPEPMLPNPDLTNAQLIEIMTPLLNSFRQLVRAGVQNDIRYQNPTQLGMLELVDAAYQNAEGLTDALIQGLRARNHIITATTVNDRLALAENIGQLQSYFRWAILINYLTPIYLEMQRLGLVDRFVVMEEPTKILNLLKALCHPTEHRMLSNEELGESFRIAQPLVFAMDEALFYTSAFGLANAMSLSINQARAQSYADQLSPLAEQYGLMDEAARARVNVAGLNAHLFSVITGAAAVDATLVLNNENVMAMDQGAFTLAIVVLGAALGAAAVAPAPGGADAGAGDAHDAGGDAGHGGDGDVPHDAGHGADEIAPLTDEDLVRILTRLYDSYDNLNRDLLLADEIQIADDNHEQLQLVALLRAAGDADELTVELIRAQREGRHLENITVLGEAGLNLLIDQLLLEFRVIVINDLLTRYDAFPTPDLAAAEDALATLHGFVVARYNSGETLDAVRVSADTFRPDNDGEAVGRFDEATFYETTRELQRILGDAPEQQLIARVARLNAVRELHVALDTAGGRIEDEAHDATLLALIRRAVAIELDDVRAVEAVVRPADDAFEALVASIQAVIQATREAVAHHGYIADRVNAVLATPYQTLRAENSDLARDLTSANPAAQQLLALLQHAAINHELIAAQARVLTQVLLLDGAGLETAVEAARTAIANAYQQYVDALNPLREAYNNLDAAVLLRLEAQLAANPQAQAIIHLLAHYKAADPAAPIAIDSFRDSRAAVVTAVRAIPFVQIHALAPQVLQQIRLAQGGVEVVLRDLQTTYGTLRDQNTDLATALNIDGNLDAQHILDTLRGDADAINALATVITDAHGEAAFMANAAIVRAEIASAYHSRAESLNTLFVNYSLLEQVGGTRGLPEFAPGSNQRNILDFLVHYVAQPRAANVPADIEARLAQDAAALAPEIVQVRRIGNEFVAAAGEVADAIDAALNRVARDRAAILNRIRDSYAALPADLVVLDRAYENIYPLVAGEHAVPVDLAGADLRQVRELRARAFNEETGALQEAITLATKAIARAERLNALRALHNALLDRGTRVSEAAVRRLDAVGLAVLDLIDRRAHVAEINPAILRPIDEIMSLTDAEFGLALNTIEYAMRAVVLNGLRTTYDHLYAIRVAPAAAYNAILPAMQSEEDVNALLEGDEYAGVRALTAEAFENQLAALQPILENRRRAAVLTALKTTYDLLPDAVVIADSPDYRGLLALIQRPDAIPEDLAGADYEAFAQAAMPGDQFAPAFLALVHAIKAAHLEVLRGLLGQLRGIDGFVLPVIADAEPQHVFTFVDSHAGALIDAALYTTAADGDDVRNMYSGNFNAAVTAVAGAIRAQITAGEAAARRVVYTAIADQLTPIAVAYGTLAESNGVIAGRITFAPLSPQAEMLVVIRQALTDGVDVDPDFIENHAAHLAQTIALYTADNAAFVAAVRAIDTAIAQAFNIYVPRLSELLDSYRALTVDARARIVIPADPAVAANAQAIVVLLGHMRPGQALDLAFLRDTGDDEVRHVREMAPDAFDLAVPAVTQALASALLAHRANVADVLNPVLAQYRALAAGVVTATAADPESVQAIFALFRDAALPLGAIIPDNTALFVRIMLLADADLAEGARIVAEKIRLASVDRAEVGRAIEDVLNRLLGNYGLLAGQDAGVAAGLTIAPNPATPRAPAILAILQNFDAANRDYIHDHAAAIRDDAFDRDLFTASTDAVSERIETAYLRPHAQRLNAQRAPYAYLVEAHALGGLVTPADGEAIVALLAYYQANPPAAIADEEANIAAIIAQFRAAAIPEVTAVRRRGFPAFNVDIPAVELAIQNAQRSHIADSLDTLRAGYQGLFQQNNARAGAIAGADAAQTEILALLRAVGNAEINLVTINTHATANALDHILALNAADLGTAVTAVQVLIGIAQAEQNQARAQRLESLRLIYAELDARPGVDAGPQTTIVDYIDLAEADEIIPDDMPGMAAAAVAGIEEVIFDRAAIAVDLVLRATRLDVLRASLAELRGMMGHENPNVAGNANAENVLGFVTAHVVAATPAIGAIVYRDDATAPANAVKLLTAEQFNAAIDAVAGAVQAATAAAQLVLNTRIDRLETLRQELETLRALFMGAAPHVAGHVDAGHILGFIEAHIAAQIDPDVYRDADDAHADPVRALLTAPFNEAADRVLGAIRAIRLEDLRTALIDLHAAVRGARPDMAGNADAAIILAFITAHEADAAPINGEVYRTAADGNDLRGLIGVARFNDAADIVNNAIRALMPAVDPAERIALLTRFRALHERLVAAGGTAIAHADIPTVIDAGLHEHLVGLITTNAEVIADVLADPLNADLLSEDGDFTAELQAIHYTIIARTINVAAHGTYDALRVQNAFLATNFALPAGAAAQQIVALLRDNAAAGAIEAADITDRVTAAADYFGEVLPLNAAALAAATTEVVDAIGHAYDARALRLNHLIGLYRTLLPYRAALDGVTATLAAIGGPAGDEQRNIAALLAHYTALPAAAFTGAMLGDVHAAAEVVNVRRIEDGFDAAADAVEAAINAALALRRPAVIPAAAALALAVERLPRISHGVPVNGPTSTRESIEQAIRAAFHLQQPGHLALMVTAMDLLKWLPGNGVTPETNIGADIRPAAEALHLHHRAGEIVAGTEISYAQLVAQLADFVTKDFYPLWSLLLAAGVSAAIILHHLDPRAPVAVSTAAQQLLLANIKSAQGKTIHEVYTQIKGIVPILRPNSDVVLLSEASPTDRMDTYRSFGALATNLYLGPPPTVSLAFFYSTSHACMSTKVKRLLAPGAADTFTIYIPALVAGGALQAINMPVADDTTLHEVMKALVSAPPRAGSEATPTEQLHALVMTLQNLITKVSDRLELDNAGGRWATHPTDREVRGLQHDMALLLVHWYGLYKINMVLNELYRIEPAVFAPMATLFNGNRIPVPDTMAGTAALIGVMKVFEVGGSAAALRHASVNVVGKADFNHVRDSIAQTVQEHGPANALEPVTGVDYPACRRIAGPGA